MPIIKQTANESKTEIEISALRQQVANLSSQASAQSLEPNSQLGPCSGHGIEGSTGFVIARVALKAGEQDTFCVQPLPANADKLHVIIGKVSDQSTKSATLNKVIKGITASDQKAGHFEFTFPHHLDFNAQYGAIQIKAYTEDSGFAQKVGQFPATDPWNGTQYTYFDTWTTGPALNAPGAPNCSTDILGNTLWSDAANGHARVTVQVWADPTHTLSFSQQQATKYGVRLVPADDATDTQFVHKSSPVSNDSDLSEKLVMKLPLGITCKWHDVWLSHGTGKVFSPVSDCQFTAGGFDASQADLTTLAANATLSFAAYDAKHVQITLNFTQPSNPLMLTKGVLQRSVDGGATWQNWTHAEFQKEASVYWTSGAQSYTYIVHTKVAFNHLFRVVFHAIPQLVATAPVFGYGSANDPTGDPGPAGAVVGLTGDWEGKGGLIVRWQDPATNWSSGQYYLLWATDPSGTNFMQLISSSTVKAGQIAVPNTQAGAQLQHAKSHDHFHNAMKLKNVDPAFLSGIKFNVQPWNIVNNVLTGGAVANLQIAPGQEFLDANDAVNVLNVGMLTGVSTDQILFNGNCVYSNGTAGQLGSWFNGFGSVRTPIVVGGLPFRWNQANNTIECVGPITSVGFTQRLGKWLAPGDYFAASLLASVAASQFVTVSVFIVDEGTGSTNVAIIPSQSFIGTGSFAFYGFQMQYNASSPFNQSLIYSVTVPSGAVLALGRFMFNRGTQPLAYAPRKLGELNGTSTGWTGLNSENPAAVDTTPSPAVAGGAGISSATGSFNPSQVTQGGWGGSGISVKLAGLQ